MKDIWNEIESRTRTFRLGTLPELIHIIKTGYVDTYMIVDETGYEMLGSVQFMNSQQILEIYKIDINCEKHL